MTESKAREFWLNPSTDEILEYEPHSYNSIFNEHIHVIEKSAYDRLERKFFQSNKERNDFEKELQRVQNLLDDANRKLDEIHDTFYGQNIKILGWHLNGELEPIDTFFENNNWQSEKLQSEAECE